MPNIIRLELPEAVFYLYRLEPDGETRTGPWGTGFLVIKPSARDIMGKPHVYGVSNWHLVSGKCGASIIRVNTRDGRSRFIELEPGEWEIAKDGDDMVAVDLTDKIDPNTDQTTGIHEHLFLPPPLQLTEWYRFWIGEDAFMCGLFASHHGGSATFPSCGSAI
jgi:hypothetical protein